MRAADVEKARYARLGDLIDPDNGSALDRILSVFFPRPASFTGEDVVEWHCHGGQATIRAILAALERQGWLGNFLLREAEPGEFTRRAFENGQIDLNEAEGLADLLNAQTESQRRAALSMADGHFSRRVDIWREQLLRSAAMAESLLDFSDEGDVPESEQILRADIAALLEEMNRQLATPSAEKLNEGISVVLAGPPNAGKSTLLNALVGREAAIVSDIAGTTRDRIEVPVEIGGIAFVLTDTAGLAEDSGDAIEMIGMDRARRAIATCDILLWLGDAADAPRADAVLVAAQCDRREDLPKEFDVALSAVTGENMNRLHELIVSRASALVPTEGGYALHKRQKDAVAVIAQELDEAASSADLLIVAEHLRRARVGMDRLTGRSGVEDMLGALFSRFCIGK